MCGLFGFHNFYREAGAAVEVPRRVRECLTPGCREHTPADTTLGMTNVRPDVFKCLTINYGRPGGEKIDVVHS
jgi:hypothetical protein